jgi:hypothetical protein
VYLHPGCVPLHQSWLLLHSSLHNSLRSITMLYVFFWVILNFICPRFGTLCLFHLHRWIGMKDDWV